MFDILYRDNPPIFLLNPEGREYVRWCSILPGIEAHGDVLTGGLRRNTRDVSASKSGWIAVLIVDIALHPKFFTIVQATIPQVEPLFAKIFGDQSGTRMDKHSAEAKPLELGELLLETTPLEFVVPHPKRHRPIFSRGVGKR
jgi:hypothetical protein